MALFKHSVFMCSINCLFLFICLLIFGDLSKMILLLSICIALWDFYYMHLFFQDMEDDFNRLADFLKDDFNKIVDFLNTFLGFFSKFYQCFANVLDNLPWRQLIRFNGIIIWN